MIDNNIIKSLGAGSGIDSPKLIKELTEIERAAPQERIDKQRERAQNQISDFGLMASAMDSLKSSLKALSDPEGLFSKTASFTESNALVPAKLATNVQPGSYSFEVNQLARSQSVSFGGMASITDPVGEGEITFNLGTWARDDKGVATEFNQNLEKEPFSIKIDSTNNSLRGLRDAINAADKGLQASIVNDGTSHRLVVTAASGEAHELEMVVTEAQPDSGLARFAFNADVPDFQTRETQSGADAKLTINGLPVTRSSNTVEDVVEGLTLNLLKASPGEVVTVTVSEDKAFAEQNVRDFVDAYNEFLKETKPLMGYDKEEEKYGSLANDPLAKSVLSRFRTSIASAIPGLTDSNFSSLANMGIRTQLDGTLSINEKDFSNAFANNFEDVQKLLGPHKSSTSSDVNVNTFGKQTQAGEYEVVITQPPVKGFYTGGTVAAETTFPLDTTGKDYQFRLSLDGVASGDIKLPEGAVYQSAGEMAEALQLAINADSKLRAARATVAVSFDELTNGFKITSNRYGANSNVNITAASQDLTDDLGLTVAQGTRGINVAGTIDGVEGFGLGNVLRAKLGEPAEGLSMIIGENATTATVSVSRGFAGQMEQTINQFLQKNGLFDNREDVLNRRIDKLDADESNLDRRMEAFQERLMRQFISMERILNSLNSQGGFLESLIDTLPFTRKN